MKLQINVPISGLDLASLLQGLTYGNSAGQAENARIVAVGRFSKRDERLEIVELTFAQEAPCNNP